MPSSAPFSVSIATHWRPLLVLGVVCHALYALSIYGIYFSSPVPLPVHRPALGYADHAPAKRVVLFVADEWSADAFFAKRGRVDAPFLRDVVEHRGSWGVAHETAPKPQHARHASLLGGTEASASEFESILNTSRQSWILGPPQLVLGAHRPKPTPLSKEANAKTKRSPMKKATAVNASTIAHAAAIPPAQTLLSLLWNKAKAGLLPLWVGRSPQIAVPTDRSRVHRTANRSLALVVAANASAFVPLNFSSVFVDERPVISLADSPRTSTVKRSGKKAQAKKTSRRTPSVHKAETAARPLKAKTAVPKTKASAKASAKAEAEADADDSCFARMQDLLYDAPEELDRDGSLFFCPFRETSRAHVDHLVSVAVNAIERFYQHDGATAYVFTSSRGSDGLRAPVVAWGAGIQQPVRPPRPATPSSTPKTKSKASTAPSQPSTFNLELPTQSRSQIQARLDAQPKQEDAAKTQWGLLRHVRKDVLQTDIPALLSALLGTPTPRGSLGVLPTAYLPGSRYRAQAVMSNARDLLRHATSTMQATQARSLLSFRPYAPFQAQVPTLVEQLETAWANDDLAQVEHLSQDLIAISLETITYFQQYKLAVVLSFLVAACLAWVGVLAIALASSSFAALGLMSSVETWFAVFVVANAAFLALEHAPLTFFMFVVCTFVAGSLVWRYADGLKTNSRLCWMVVLGIAATLELVIFRWQHRYVFGLLFVLFSVWPLLASQLLTRVLSIGCLAFGVVTYASTERGNDALLVELAGFALVVLAVSTLSRSFAVSLGPWVLGLATSLGLLHATVHYISNQVAPPMAFALLASVLAFIPVITLVVEASSPRFGYSSSGKTQPSMLHAFLLQFALALAPTPVFLLLSFPFEAMLVVALLGLLVAMLENLRVSTTPTPHAAPLKLQAKLADLSVMPAAATC